MSNLGEAAQLMVECDGDRYEVSRPAVAEGAAAEAAPCWVIRVRGYVVGKFRVVENQSEAMIRETACEVIRHGSTTTYPCPPEN